MFSADAEEKLPVLSAIKGVHWVSAEQVKRVMFRQGIPQLFKADSRIPLALGPQKCNHLSIYYEPLFRPGGGLSLGDNRANRIFEFLFIGYAGHHKASKRFLRIQFYILLSSYRGRQVDFAAAQYLAKLPGMRLGCHHDGGVALGQCCSNIIAECLQQDGVIVIELNSVAA